MLSFFKPSWISVPLGLPTPNIVDSTSEAINEAIAFSGNDSSTRRANSMESDRYEPLCVAEVSTMIAILEATTALGALAVGFKLKANNVWSASW